jgi:hypothetical protein
MKGLVLVEGVTVNFDAFVTSVFGHLHARDLTSPGGRAPDYTGKNPDRTQGCLDVIVKYDSDGKRTRSPSQQHIILLTEIFQFMTYA